jgi:hypothetical protein
MVVDMHLNFIAQTAVKELVNLLRKSSWLVICIDEGLGINF